MKQTKGYNPNTFNAAHAALAFLLFWLAMAGATAVVYWVIESIQEKGVTITDITPFLCMETGIIAVALALVVGIVSLIARVNPVSGGGFLAREGLGTEKLMTAVGVCGMAILFAPLAEKVAWDFSVMQSLFSDNTGTGIDPDLLKNTFLLFVYTFVLVPLIPAVFEELLFRGVIMRGFSEWGKTTGVILSAAAFALAHGNTSQLVYQFLLGLAIGFLVIETRSLGVGMLAHFANNFFVQVLAIVETIPSEWPMAHIYASVIGIMSVLIALVCFVAAFLYFGRRFLHSQKHAEKACAETCATVYVKDSVLGEVEENIVWHQTGKLLAVGSEDVFFTTNGKNRIKCNKKSKTKRTIWFTAITFVVAITRLFLAFFEIV